MFCVVLFLRVILWPDFFRYRPVRAARVAPSRVNNSRCVILAIYLVLRGADVLRGTFPARDSMARLFPISARPRGPCGTFTREQQPVRYIGDLSRLTGCRCSAWYFSCA